MKYFALSGRSEAVVDWSHGLRAGGRLEVDQQWAARGGLCLDEEHSPDLRRPEILEIRDHEYHRFTYKALLIVIGQDI